MEKATELYQWLYDDGVYFFDRQLPFSKPDSKATTIKLGGDTWGIFVDAERIETTAEENAIVLHECGHYATETTHEVCSPCDLVEKHEYKANKWAVMKALSADELDEAIASGCTNIWSLAEHFNLPIDFMRMAVSWYTYGNLSDGKDIC